MGADDVSEERVPIAARLSGVGFDYGGFTAVDGVTVDIGPGITGLLGLNGVGKTTLLRMVATVTSPTRGHMEVLGADTAAGGLTEVRRRLGYLPQNASWTASLRVRELLEVFCWMRHVPPRQVQARVDRALDRSGLGPLAKRRLGALSGGQHRRAMLAQALLADPGLLVLDEPTAGLDPQQRVEFRRLLVEVARDTATIISTHLLEDVSTVADRVLVLDSGSLVFDGTPGDLAGASDGTPSATALEQGFLRVTGQARGTA
jgi:ABC-2 type transport system ATP-binding protein